MLCLKLLLILGLTFQFFTTTMAFFTNSLKLYKCRPNPHPPNDGSCLGIRWNKDDEMQLTDHYKYVPEQSDGLVGCANLCISEKECVAFVNEIAFPERCYLYSESYGSNPSKGEFVSYFKQCCESEKEEGIQNRLKRKSKMNPIKIEENKSVSNTGADIVQSQSAADTQSRSAADTQSRSTGVLQSIGSSMYSSFQFGFCCPILFLLFFSFILL